MGGEKFYNRCHLAQYLGSPPHGRGKDFSEVCFYVDDGITPAWAGKRMRLPFGVSSGWDHPRMGGEKSCWPGLVAGLPGSPPHGRGKAAGELQRTRPAGITPAWAGKSEPDHGGSPPHGRGKVLAGGLGAAVQGITPAWAGKRQNLAVKVKPLQDHPRMGGEKSRTLMWEISSQGSPPHGRGKEPGAFWGH